MGLVMFDYDGVIVDSFDQVCTDFITACRAHGFEIKNADDFNNLHDDNCYKVMKEQYGLKDETIDDILREYEVTAGNHLNLNIFEGIRDAINDISKKHRVVVITSNISENVCTVLRDNDVTAFEDVVGAEKEKSKIKKILRAMELYPSVPAYYIGDTAGDMIEGRKAGALTIAVAWEWHSPERLKKTAPDYLVYTPGELAAFLCGTPVR